MPTRRHLLVASASLCLFGGLSAPASAGVAIELFNPYNHGFDLGSGLPAVNEIATNRLPIAHGILFPQLGDLGDTDYTEFVPFYRVPSNNVYIGAPWTLENYWAYNQVNFNPFASQYRNVHLGWGGSASTAYFDMLERRSSALGSPGFSGNSGSLTLDSQHVDTGVGSANGSVSANGQMALKVDIKQSGGFEQTPVSEGALQATFTDKFTVNGSGPTAATTITFGARATAPTLDFSDGDFYNYAVGYQMAVFQREMLPRDIDSETGERVGPLAPVITEHWSDTGLYWMDARMVRDPFTQLPEKIRIESLGDAPPGVDGVDYTKEVLSYYPTEGNGGPLVPWAYKYIREIAVDPANPFASYDDPMMPFDKASSSGKFVLNPATGQYVRIGDISLPTGVELELVVNFFVIAGCSDLGAKTCEISIDGSHTAGVGIKFADPTVTLSSLNGFSYPQTALVPEPETYALMLAGLALIGWVAKRRKA